jgi:hypothetical protein
MNMNLELVMELRGVIASTKGPRVSINKRHLEILLNDLADEHKGREDLTQYILDTAGKLPDAKAIAAAAHQVVKDEPPELHYPHDLANLRTASRRFNFDRLITPAFHIDTLRKLEGVYRDEDTGAISLLVKVDDVAHLNTITSALKVVLDQSSTVHCPQVISHLDPKLLRKGSILEIEPSRDIYSPVVSLSLPRSLLIDGVPAYLKKVAQADGFDFCKWVLQERSVLSGPSYGPFN